MKIVSINGKPTQLSPNEHKQNYSCPICNGDLITNFGSSIIITFCLKCGFYETYYDFS